MGKPNFNTVAMAFLTVVFVVFSLSLLSDGLYHSEVEEFGYPIEVADAPAAGGEDEGPAFDPVSPILASADPSVGESVFKKCGSCHTNDPSGANKTGPGLWGVVGRAVASHEGYAYSGALEAYAAEEPEWDFEALNAFLWKPKTVVKGTSMGFAGLSSVEDRAAVIAYLNTLSDSPLPLPDPAEAQAALEAEAAPAGEATDADATEVVEGEAVSEDQVEEAGEDASAVSPAAESDPGTGDAPEPEAGLNQEMDGDAAPEAQAGELPEADAPAAADAPGDAGAPGEGPNDNPVEGATDAADGASDTQSLGGQGLDSNAIEDLGDADSIPSPQTGGDVEGPLDPIPDGGANPDQSSDAAPANDAGAPAAETDASEGTVIIVPIEPAAPAEQ